MEIKYITQMNNNPFNKSNSNYKNKITKGFFTICLIIKNKFLFFENKNKIKIIFIAMMNVKS